VAWRACEDSQQPQAAAHVLAKCQRSNRSRPKQTTESKGSECIDARPGKIGDVVGLPLAASTMGGADGKTLFCLLPRRCSLAHLSLFLPRHRSVHMPAPVRNLRPGSTVSVLNIVGYPHYRPSFLRQVLCNYDAPTLYPHSPVALRPHLFYRKVSLKSSAVSPY